jgi:hypothetical protein
MEQVRAELAAARAASSGAAAAVAEEVEALKGALAAAEGRAAAAEQSAAGAVAAGMQLQQVHRMRQSEVSQGCVGWKATPYGSSRRQQCRVGLG